MSLNCLGVPYTVRPSSGFLQVADADHYNRWGRTVSLDYRPKPDARIPIGNEMASLIVSIWKEKDPDLIQDIRVKDDKYIAKVSEARFDRLELSTSDIEAMNEAFDIVREERSVPADTSISTLITERAFGQTSQGDDLYVVDSTFLDRVNEESEEIALLKSILRSP